MARISYSLLVCLCLFAGCGRSAADLPVEERQANWIGQHRQGSCGWASLVSLLRAEGDPRAETVRAECGGTANIWFVPGDRIVKSDILDELDRLGIGHVETALGDEQFLCDACESGPGCLVGANRGAHVVDVVAIDSDSVTILGCNHPQVLFHESRRQFLNEWRQSGGWAIRPLAWWESE